MATRSPNPKSPRIRTAKRGVAPKGSHEDRVAALWRRFQEAVETTDNLLATHPDLGEAPRTDPRRAALDRCVEAARAYGAAWKQEFLATAGVA